MRKLVFHILGASTALFTLANHAYAATALIKTIINNVIDVVKLLIVLVFTLALVVFGWGVVKFIMEADNPEGVKKAKSLIIWGVIAMAVLASLTGLIQLFQDYLGIKGGGIIEVPQF